MNSDQIERIIICSRSVRNGKMTIDVDNIKEDLNVVNELCNTSFTDQTKDSDIIEYFRKVYNQLAHEDYSHNNRNAKDVFNHKYALYAHVRDRRRYA